MLFLSVYVYHATGMHAFLSEQHNNNKTKQKKTISMHWELALDGYVSTALLKHRLPVGPLFPLSCARARGRGREVLEEPQTTERGEVQVGGIHVLLQEQPVR